MRETEADEQRGGEEADGAAGKAALCKITVAAGSSSRVQTPSWESLPLAHVAPCPTFHNMGEYKWASCHPAQMAPDCCALA